MRAVRRVNDALNWKITHLFESITHLIMIDTILQRSRNVKTPGTTSGTLYTQVLKFLVGFPHGYKDEGHSYMFQEILFRNCMCLL